MILVCPNCKSKEVITTSIQRFNVNTLEYMWEAVKPHDNISEAVCLKCNFVGIRSDLVEDEDDSA